MRKKILFAVFAVMLAQVCAQAAISVDHTTSSDFLENNGYSKQIYDSVNISRARALGEEYYSSEEEKYRNSSAPGKLWRRFWSYLDPAMDDYSFYHHSTTPEPSPSDL